MTSYHQAAYTLDPTKEIPDDAPLSAGHDPQDAEQVKELHDEHREATEKAAKAQEKADREWAERDPKPKPSELLVERGHEPKADEDNGDEKKSKSKSAKKD